MTTKWAKCIVCGLTFRIPLDQKDEGQICQNCPKPDGWSPPMINVQNLPKPHIKGVSHWQDSEI